MIEMPTKPVPGLFFTGTDTGVGKTYVAGLVARALRAAGQRVGVYKPAASGCRREGGELVSDDALVLWEAAGQPGTLECVCPQRFAAPLAPHLAARAEGRQLDPDLLRRGLDYWQAASDVILVEGAGGLLSPLGDDQYVADLAHDFGFPLVIVSRNALGTINHTLQTLCAAAFYVPAEGRQACRVGRSPTESALPAPDYREGGAAPCGLDPPYGRTPPYGLPVAGIVLNNVSPPSDDPSIATNRRELEARCRVPTLAEVAFQADRFDAEVDWLGLAGRR